MERNGKLVSCDRCGKEIFLECTGEKERDGGFTRWSTFEPFPEGWESHYETGRLCPKCNEKYNQIIADFKAGIDVFMSERSENEVSNGMP